MTEIARFILARATWATLLIAHGLVLAALVLQPARAEAKRDALPTPPGLKALSAGDRAAAEALGGAFAQAVTGGDGQAIQSFIDVDGLLWSIANSPLPVEVRKDESVTGMLGSVGAGFATRIPGGSRASFRGLVDRGGELRALVRLLMGEQDSLDYIELRMARRSDGSIVVFDWYDHYQGRYAARGMRDGLALSLDELLTSEYGLEKSQLTPETVASMQQLIFEALNGNFPICLEAYARLPEDVRELREVLLSRHRAALHTGSEDALKASLSAIVARYADDPGLQLIVNDYGFLMRDQEMALASVARLLVLMNDDAAIYEMKALVYQAERELDNAREALRSAIQNDPDLLSPYWSLIDIDAQSGNYASVIASFDAIERQFGFELDAEAIARSASFGDLATSDDFARWRAARAEAEAGAPTPEASPAPATAEPGKQEASE